jgi:hypothetical protein
VLPALGLACAALDILEGGIQIKIKASLIHSVFFPLVVCDDCL